MANKETSFPKKILIVDDNEDSRNLTAIVLKRSGYEIVQACDGEEALARAFSEKPDLILLDTSLPKIDGLEVTRRLKREEGFKKVPIVALRACVMTCERGKALQAGCEGCITKPINVRTLSDEIRSYLKDRNESICTGEQQ